MDYFEILKYFIVFTIGFLSALLLFISPNNISLYAPQNFQSNSQKIMIFAVSNYDKGVSGYAKLRTVEGSDKVLINTKPFSDIDLQYSADNAVKVAKELLNVKSTKLDYMFSFEFNSSVLGGESAGAALTILTIATLTGKPIRRDVGITGTIESDGNIGKVGGILEKMIAAKKAGIKIFLIPKGQEIFRYYVPEIKKSNIFGIQIYDQYYQMKSINLIDYAKKYLNMTVVPVSNIKQVLPYFFS